MILFVKLVICFIGSCGFAFMYNAPRRAIIVSGVIGAVGYLMYTVFSLSDMPYMFCFFAAMLIISLLSEIAAIFLKTPSTVFLSIGVLALVPGLDLFKAVSMFVFGDYSGGSQIGIRAFFAVGAMAMGIAIGAYITRIVKKLFAKR